MELVRPFSEAGHDSAAIDAVVSFGEPIAFGPGDGPQGSRRPLLRRGARAWSTKSAGTGRRHRTAIGRPYSHRRQKALKQPRGDPRRGGAARPCAFHDSKDPGPEASLHQDLWLPDERLRFRKDDGRAGAVRLCRRPRRRNPPTSSSSTPAISARRRPRRSIPSSAACAGSRRPAPLPAAQVMIGVAGCVAQAEGERDHAPRAGGRPRRRAAILSPPAGAPRRGRGRRARGRDRIRRRRQVRRPRPAPAAAACRAASPPSSPCRRAATSSAPSASFPIRAAPRSRGRSRRSSPKRPGSPPSGVREITLLGQNVNAWHGEGPDGRGLGPRPRFSSGLPKSPARPAALHHQPSARHGRRADRGAPRPRALMPYLHLPVQSGSDRVLAAMNRRHSRADYLRLIDRVRAARPDIALSGDFIVGFPGESEADFADTLSHRRRGRLRLRLLVQVQPAPGHAGGDARRPGAGAGQGRAPARGCRRRSTPASSAFNRSRVGTVGRGPVRAAAGAIAGQIVGRSPWLSPVQVDGRAGADRHDQPVRIDAARREQPVRIARSASAGGRCRPAEAAA